MTLYSEGSRCKGNQAAILTTGTIVLSRYDTATVVCDRIVLSGWDGLIHVLSDVNRPTKFNARSIRGTGGKQKRVSRLSLANPRIDRNSLGRSLKGRKWQRGSLCFAASMLAGTTLSKWPISKVISNH